MTVLAAPELFICGELGINTVDKKTKNNIPAWSAALEDYADWLAELKSRLYNAQQRIALVAKRELILLY